MSEYVQVRPCTEEDLRQLLQGSTSRHDGDHHRERFDLQTRGQAVYLLAWRGPRNVGRATLYLASKYDGVRSRYPDAAEINALAADPAGQGTGTALIRVAEDHAIARDRTAVGLAVEPSNPAARRLYERLGYRLWDGEQVIDQWTHVADDGTLTHHANACDYLIHSLPGK